MSAISKIVKCDISATVWSILIKFGIAMHIRHPNLMGDQTFVENRKTEYLQKRFTDFDEILHDDTYFKPAV